MFRLVSISVSRVLNSTLTKGPLASWGPFVEPPHWHRDRFTAPFPCTREQGKGAHLSWTGLSLYLMVFIEVARSTGLISCLSTFAITCVSFTAFRDKSAFVPLISRSQLDMSVIQQSSLRVSSIAFSVLLLYTILGEARLNQCFLPNGTDINAIQPDGFQSWYLPCNRFEGQHGMCCQIEG